MLVYMPVCPWTLTILSLAVQAVCEREKTDLKFDCVNKQVWMGEWVTEKNIQLFSVI